MGDRGIVGELPSDMLHGLLQRDPSWVVDFLRNCTLFDADMTGLLLRIGIQACRAELDRREGTPLEAANDEQVAAMNDVAPPPHPAPDDSLEMLF